MSSKATFIKDAMDADLFKQSVTMYLQLLKATCIHFVDEEYYCYFDELYSPEYIFQGCGLRFGHVERKS